MQNVVKPPKYNIYGGIMKLYPRNRHLVIEPIEEEEEKTESAVLVPDGYGKPKPPFLQARVKEVSPDCTSSFSKGDRILIERSMLQELSIEDFDFYLVLENYVYGVLSTR